MSGGFAKTHTSRAAIWSLKANVVNGHEYATTLATVTTLTSKALPIGYGAGGFAVNLYIVSAGTGAYTLSIQHLMFDTGPDSSGAGVYLGEEWSPSQIISTAGTFATTTWLSVPFSPDATKAIRILLRNDSATLMSEVRGFQNWGG